MVFQVVSAYFNLFGGTRKRLIVNDNFALILTSKIKKRMYLNSFYSVNHIIRSYTHSYKSKTHAAVFIHGAPIRNLINLKGTAKLIFRVNWYASRIPNVFV